MVFNLSKYLNSSLSSTLKVDIFCIGNVNLDPFDVHLIGICVIMMRVFI